MPSRARTRAINKVYRAGCEMVNDAESVVFFCITIRYIPTFYYLCKRKAIKTAS